MHLGNYLDMIHRAEIDLADGFRQVAEAHKDEPDIHGLCQKLAIECERHAEALRPIVERYGSNHEDEPDRLSQDLFQGTRTGGLGLVRDLQDLYIMASDVDITWVVLGQAAQALGDRELLQVVTSFDHETATQLKWLKTRIKSAAPQALLVAS
jgi:rubrerythrin